MGGSFHRWVLINDVYVEDNISMTYLAKKYNFNVSHIKHKIKVYEIHGEAPFTDEQEKRTYIREEKLKAINQVLSGEKSARQLSAELGTPDASTVGDWVRLYKLKGEDAIQISRGRKKYMLQKERQSFLADKEIKARCKHLEEENEILKKSLALALPKNKQLRKRFKLLMSSRAK